MTLFYDSETFSPTPITAGTYRYASDAEVMLVTYALDDGPVGVWDLTAGERMPGDLHYAIHHLDDEVVAQNSMFDRTVTRLSKNLRLDIPLERWRCSMARALAHSLPGGLDKLGEIFNLPQDARKLKSGRQLIHLFCKPQHSPRLAGVPLQPYAPGLWRATRATHPQKWAEFIDYARSDIPSMRAIWQRLPAWNYSGRELALWHRDQRANDRGFAVDTDLARAALRLVEHTKGRLARDVQHRTRGAVGSAAQRDALLAHILQEYGVDLPDMQASTIERRVNDHALPIELRELLAIRLQATTTSTSKYKSLVNAEVNGRLHGTMQFCGAGRTGRWAHRLFQPGNMPRPNMSADEIFLAIDAIKGGFIEAVHDDVMNSMANAIRGCIVAGPGKKLVVSDLSNIEGVAATWIAGEKWKLKAFADYYAGIAADLYIVAYARAFNVPQSSIDKKTVEGYFKRQIGKVMELMLQYQGGVGAFITGAATYKIDLDAMAEAAFPAIPTDVWEEADDFYEWTTKQGRNTFGLAKKVFCVCDSLKRLWRRAHPAISSMWPELESTVAEAIEPPGNTFTCRVLRIRRDGAWLRVVLPSGRALCYPSPQVDDGKISYMGVNQYTKKWQRIGTYGGKLFENVCQALARDVLVNGLELAEAEGYEYVLSIHDELIMETPDSAEFNAARLSALMATVPDWAPGMPLAAAGFEGYRYRKE